MFRVILHIDNPLTWAYHLLLRPRGSFAKQSAIGRNTFLGAIATLTLRNAPVRRIPQAVTPLGVNRRFLIPPAVCLV